ncbi:PadR family transcriptional regulator [Paenibacillus sp. HW567]|uniref:PadR family transcriptional regulator n=1 Tax=Paenibacillus sp. HW567 TaxID=1034769 RepID=UPI00035CD5C0|nr:PadR family transcriptional regulator [Paenibacillus sp. HW567]
MDIRETIHGLTLELRRGTIILGVLSQLSEPQYGYSLVPVLKERGIPVEPNTLYPLLRRLEKQGLLDSAWDTNEARPRKYYSLSPAGKEVYERLCGEWNSLKISIDSLIEGGGNHGTD